MIKGIDTYIARQHIADSTTYRQTEQQKNSNIRHKGGIIIIYSINIKCITTNIMNKIKAILGKLEEMQVPEKYKL